MTPSSAPLPQVVGGAPADRSEAPASRSGGSAAKSASKRAAEKQRREAAAEGEAVSFADWNAQGGFRTEGTGLGLWCCEPANKPYPNAITLRLYPIWEAALLPEWLYTPGDTQECVLSMTPKSL